MKRHALLLGYTGWDIQNQRPLVGVRTDINNYTDYLMSLKGGAWYRAEITTLIDNELKDIDSILTEIKEEDNDIVFIAYSGHGYYSKYRDCRAVEISKNNIMYEYELLGISKREILILDSCAGYYSEDISESLEKKSRIIAKATNANNVLIARQKYEEYCRKCPEQELIFYAAQEGLSARDSAMGGYYTKNLLKVLRKSEEYMDIAYAHDIASKIVTLETKNKQIPDCDVPKIHNLLPGALDI